VGNGSTTQGTPRGPIQGKGGHQENRKFAFSAFPSRISGNKREKRGNYEIIKQDPPRSSAKSMKSSVQFS